MIENSTQGLTLLDADLDVQVVATEHFGPALLRWTPGPDGRAVQVAAELVVVVDEVGQQWVEVRIDDVPVGELAPDDAQRHAAHIAAVLDRGGRPGVIGLVRPGPHVELRLPDPAAPVRAPLPPALPPAARPDRFDPEERWPSERPARSRLPVLIGGGVLALLVAVGVVVGTRGGEEPEASAVRSAVPPLVAPTSAPTVTPTPIATPVPTRVERAAPAPRTRTPRPARTRTPAPPTPAPARTPSPTPVAPAPPPPAPVTPAPTAVPVPAPSIPAGPPVDGICDPLLLADPDCS